MIHWKKFPRKETIKNPHINPETHTDFKDLWLALLKY